jgi:hypothetical protein
MQTQIVELKKLGRMPDESQEDIEDSLIDQYDSLLKAVTLPISYDEAEVLIALFPENALFGVQWSLLHTLESIYGCISKEEYEKLIERCPSQEWKNTLKRRLENSLNKI